MFTCCSGTSFGTSSEFLLIVWKLIFHGGFERSNIFDKHRPITSSCFPTTYPPWKFTTSWKLMVGFSINFLLTWSLFGWHALIPRGCVCRSTFHLTGQATHRVVQESSETHPPRIPAGIFLTGSFNLTSNLDLAKCLESQVVPYYFKAIVAGF